MTAMSKVLQRVSIAQGECSGQGLPAFDWSVQLVKRLDHTFECIP
jgi:hypothetical protein